MANYLTTDTDLTSVANAIRTKSSEIITPPTWESYIAGLLNRAYVSDVKGIIFASYSPGSTCTCSNGTTTLTAPNTNGMVNFGVGMGNWTVTCGNKSWPVTINKRKQIETVNFTINSTLNNNSWATISQVARAGVGDDYWDIGDCKAITLNGQIGDYKILSNETAYVFILDFNHPINKTTTDNNIIFGGFKSALTNGIDFCYCDSEYGNNKSDPDYNLKYFNINHYGDDSGVPYHTNYGGWKGCDFRYDILGAVEIPPTQYGTIFKVTYNVGSDATQVAITNPVSNTLMAALPSDFRNVLRLWTRWVDNVGNQSNIDANVSACVDAGISLLAEYEIFGARSVANQYEQNHQKQMTYYTNGNSKIKYHDLQEKKVAWAECSPAYNYTHRFCFVTTSGSATSYTSRISGGLAPAFKV